MTDIQYNVQLNRGGLLGRGPVESYTYKVSANNVEFNVTSKTELTDEQIRQKIQYNNVNSENEFVFCDLDDAVIQVKNLASASFEFDSKSDKNTFINGTRSGVNVTVKGDNNDIYTGDGSDYISIEGGILNTVSTGGGDDSVSISQGGSYNEVETGSGKDTINVVDGRMNTVDGGTGKDTFKVDKEAEKTTVKAKGNTADEIINQGKESIIESDRKDHVR